MSTRAVSALYKYIPTYTATYLYVPFPSLIGTSQSEPVAIVCLHEKSNSTVKPCS
jgi:hypothetical protein